MKGPSVDYRQTPGPLKRDEHFCPLGQPGLSQQYAGANPALQAPPTQIRPCWQSQRCLHVVGACFLHNPDAVSQRAPKTSFDVELQSWRVEHVGTSCIQPARVSIQRALTSLALPTH